MEAKRITLRIPESLYDWIAARADEKVSTVTGEIIAILRDAMEDGYTTPEQARRIALETVREELAKAGIKPPR